MKRPLLPVACAYVVGLLLAEFLHPRLGFLFGVSGFVLALATLWRHQREWLLWLSLALVGWTNLASRTAVISSVDLRRTVGNNATLVKLRGTLLETPSQRVFEREEREIWRSLARVKVTELSRGGNWEPVSGTVITSTSGQLPPSFFDGQPVEISGLLAPPRLPVAEGLFNYPAFLARQGIYHQLQAESAGDWRLLEGAKTGLPWSERFLTWGQQTLAQGLPDQAHDQPLRLLWAMTLGWRPALTNDVSEPFMLSGTMHIFAISGLHIALIAGILVSVLRVARLSRAWCGLVVIPLIWFYTGATGWQSSAVRSTVMMTIIIGGWALRRPSDLINSLMAAAFLILVCDPQQLFQASFQLSFFVVLSIALFLPPLETKFNRWLAHDPLLAAALIPWWRRWLDVLLHWLVKAFATSLAAWLGALPLTAHYFHLFSPVTLLANLVVVPASTLALACNLGSLICGNWLPVFTELFNHAGWACMWFMVWASVTATEIPGAYFHVPSPGVAGFIIYYGLLIGTLSGWLFAKPRRAWSVAAVVGLILAAIARWQLARDEVRLTVLPLNGAHAVWVDADGRRNDWLFDCGNTNSVEFVTKPFLRAQGVNRLPSLLLRHGDLRYVGGVEPLHEDFGLRDVYTSPVRFRSPTYRRILDDLDPQVPHRLVHRGDRLGAWRVLHPEPDDKFSQADDAALVLLGEFHSTRVLLLSDLGRPGQETLMRREADLRADIVVTGLPEQTEALSVTLLERIQPKVIIVADSEFPATKRASVTLRARLDRAPAKVFYTRTSGAVTLEFDKSGWTLCSMQDGELEAHESGGRMETRDISNRTNRAPSDVETKNLDGGP